MNAVVSTATADRGSRRRLVWLTVAIFVPLALLTAGVLYLLYQTQAAAARSAQFAQELKAIELGQQRISIALDTVVSDIRFLSRQSTLQRWLASDDPQVHRALTDEYASFITEKGVYDYVSYYDLNKGQAIRVHADGARPEVLSATSPRQVFEVADAEQLLELRENQIHISPFGLKAQPNAAAAIVPVVGFSVAVHDRDGDKRGILQVNYLIEQLLRRVKSLRDQGTIWVLNGDGYWLLGPSPDLEWAFARQGGADASFARDHAQAWAQINAQPDNGQFVVDGHLYSYIRIASGDDLFPLAALSAVELDIDMPPLFIVTYVAADKWAAARRTLAEPLVSLGGVLLLLSAIISAVLAAHFLHRRKAADALKASEERFRAVLESAPDAVIISDTDGQIVLANAQAEKLFGYTRDQLIGRHVEILLPERFRGTHIGHRTKYVTTPRPRAMGEGRTLYGLRADGSEFPVAVSLSPAHTESGVLVITDIRDVTEQEEVERQIKDLNSRLTRDNLELEALNKELESFSYSVSHDLRAPLRAIDGFSQALQEDCEEQLSESGKGYITRVRQAAQRMGQLIDDLLRLSRVTRANLAAEDVDLTEMAQEVAAVLQAADQDRAGAFIIEDKLNAHGDARLLRIVLENLLGNAWKFTSGRSPAQIKFGALAQDGETVYYVQDNGAGFDMAYVDQLFGAFRRLHDARQFPGTGIGLATVQRIIHRHGGRIWAEAAVDQGATFYFTLYEGSEFHGI